MVGIAYSELPAELSLYRTPFRLQSFLLTGPLALHYSERLGVWLLLVLIGGLLLYKHRGKAPGWPRLMVAVPLLALNFALPLLFDGKTEQNTNVSCFIATAALSSFKVLGWVMNRGPLVRPLTPVQFLAVYALPITPREEHGAVSGERVVHAASAPPLPSSSNGGGPSGAGGGAEGDPQAKGPKGGPSRGRHHGGRLHESAGTPLENLRNFLLKAAAGTAVGFVLLNYRHLLPRQVTTFLYGFSLYCCLGMAMDGPAALAGSLMGMSIAPHFDNPYHSTSISEFWNKRWNLTVSNALRFCFYDPIYEGRLVRDPRVSPAFSLTRRALGLLASFFMSGVLHELLIWYFSGRLYGLQLAYFTLWAPLIMVERVLRRGLRRRGVQVPGWLAWLLAMTIIQAAGDRLFWEPHYRLGTPDRALAAFEAAAPWMRVQ